MWGGEKLKTILHKNYSAENIGESWELSDVERYESKVAAGFHSGKTIKELVSIYKDELVGKSVYEKFGNEFPLLIKFIDAKTPLSIQVHPGDEMAKHRHNSFGKNEMWYVMHAEQGAELIVGFDEEINKDEYQRHLSDGTILEVMHHKKVKAGDTFYIPTGRIHAIGAGVLLAEIQQKSDVTYRIYDYNRVDKKIGKKRELHNDLALDVVDFTRHQSYKTEYELRLNQSNKLVHSPFFQTNILSIEGSYLKDRSSLDSFTIYMCMEGKVSIRHNKVHYTLEMGEIILIPAILDELEFIGSHTVLLECYL